jgi:hypothetical protein
MQPLNNSGILQVKQANYLPAKVTLRAWMTQHFATVNFNSEDYAEIVKDPLVIALSGAEIIPLQKAPMPKKKS